MEEMWCFLPLYRTNIQPVMLISINCKYANKNWAYKVHKHVFKLNAETSTMPKNKPPNMYLITHTMPMILGPC
jgi:hypothetical protein